MDTKRTALPDGWRALPEGGRLDCLVAEHVIGLHVERVTPEWYQRDGQPPRHVLLFFAPGQPLVRYSWDAHSCNACMWRNGVDESDGTAPPLPSFSSDPDQMTEVIAAMRGRGFRMKAIQYTDDWYVTFARDAIDSAPWLAEQVPELPLAICRAALAAIESE